MFEVLQRTRGRKITTVASARCVAGLQSGRRRGPQVDRSAGSLTRNALESAAWRWVHGCPPVRTTRTLAHPSWTYRSQPAAADQNVFAGDQTTRRHRRATYARHRPRTRCGRCSPTSRAMTRPCLPPSAADRGAGQKPDHRATAHTFRAKAAAGTRRARQPASPSAVVLELARLAGCADGGRRPTLASGQARRRP
jgi:hypothetical protein